MLNFPGASRMALGSIVVMCTGMGMARPASAREARIALEEVTVTPPASATSRCSMCR